MNSYPVLRQLLDTPITDTSNLTSFPTTSITNSSTPFTAVIHPIPRQPILPPPKLTLIFRPRTFLPLPGQFLATKRLKHNNEVYYKTLHQYNELSKSHEVSLDSLLLANSFQNLSVNTFTTKSRNTFAQKKLPSRIAVLQPYKIVFNHPLDAKKHTPTSN